MIQIKNILTPIDFSSNSNQVFELGYSIAQQNHARLHLIHIIDPNYYEKQQNENANIDFIRRIRLENAKEELEKFKFELPYSDVDIVEVLIEGTPHKTIIDYSKQNDIDMIIIGSHGWTNLPTKVMGSIADKIMRQADIPVICLKSNVPVIRNRVLRRQNFAENWVG
jgi:nucleotide-binding universal stress UspA family protein